MGTLDPVLVDVATQVGISTSKAASVLSTLLSSMIETPGGLTAFVERFRQSGCEELIASWLGGSLRPVSNSELETALGRDCIDKAATRAGLPFPTTASALSFLLPQLIHRLTPGGVIPSRIPSDILAYIQPAKPQMTARPSSDSRLVGKSSTTVAPHWLWPVLILLTLVLLGCWLWIVRHSRQNGRIRRRHSPTMAHGTGRSSPLAIHS
ncbi:MAG TPA: YidB family protein [Methylomirabilota bacterium]|nr:YidB family protein [Methylomirabilota bacterium]